METVINLFQIASYALLVGMGIALKVFISMRKFNRRTWGGWQIFRNYFVGFITKFAEGILNTLATILIYWGLIGCLLHFLYEI